MLANVHCFTVQHSKWERESNEPAGLAYGGYVALRATATFSKAAKRLVGQDWSSRSGTDCGIQEGIEIGSLQQSPVKDDRADTLRVADSGKRISVE